MSTDLDDSVEEPDNAVIKQLRARADKADEAEALAEKFQKENIVLRADLGHLSEKQLKALTAAHDGEWDVDGIRQTASDLGFSKAETSDEKQLPEGEVESMRKAQEATHGETPAPQPDADGIINGTYDTYEDYLNALRNAGISNRGDL